MSQTESIYPLAYGNEEELSLMVRYQGNMPSIPATRPLVKLALPDDVVMQETFLSNGGRLYWDRDHLESATAECASIEDLLLRIHASEALYVQALATANRDELTHLRINRRVVDGHGKGWGMHDNFGFQNAGEKFGNTLLMNVVLGHLATRSFITGTGLVTREGYQYAQKASMRHHDISGYGYAPYMLRLAMNSQRIADRVEVRCGDINLSDAAARRRVGGTALALAIQQTKFAKHAPSLGVPYLEMMQLSNSLLLREDGTIRRRPPIVAALGYNRWLAETGLSLADTSYTLPQELHAVAKDLLSYCDDFEAVLRGDATIDSLCGQTDWADKISVIQYGRQRDKASGKKRHKYDEKEQAQDILYDQIDIISGDNPDDKSTITYGWGYRRQRDKHGYRPSAAAIASAISTPPETRAKVRAGLVRDGYRVVEWDCVMIEGERYFLPDPLSDKVA